MIEPFLQPIEFTSPSISLFFLTNFCFCIFSLFGLFFLYKKNILVIARPAYVIALSVIFIYQLPLVLFSLPFSETLIRYWRWAFVIHVTVLFLLLYIAGSIKLIKENSDCFYVDKKQNININTCRFFILFILLIGFSLIYLYGVPFKCTGIYALIYDPSLTLLAREFGIKIVGGGLSTYAFGAAVNTLAPVVFSLAIYKTLYCFRDFSLHWAAFYLLISLFVLFLIMLGGVKGLLLPSLVVAAITLLVWQKGLVSKIISVAFTVIFVFLIILGFEMLRERPSVSGENYKFAQCASRLGKCSESINLIKSLHSRDESLGISNEVVHIIEKELYKTCERPALSEAHSTSYKEKNSSLQRPVSQLVGEVKNEIDNNQTKLKEELVDTYDGSIKIEIDTETFETGVKLSLGRVGEIVNSIISRAIVTPIQVAVWHFLYSERFSIDGKLTLPFAKKIWGESLNMPEIVYQEYGVIYSGGDSTSTSTSPTSFIWTYTAYLGLFGLFLALLLVVVIDLLWVYLLRYADENFIPVYAGLAFVLALNFMVSDFLTVMISHGGWAGFLVLILFSKKMSKFNFIG